MQQLHSQFSAPPTAPTDTADKRPPSMWRMAAAPGISLVIMSVVTNLLLLTGPLFMLQIYDRVLASKSVPTLVALFGLVVALYGVYAFLELLRSRMALRISTMFSTRTGPRIFGSIIATHAASGGRATGDVVRDVDTVRQFLAGPGPLALLDLPWLPFYLAIVFLFHPLLGWLATAGAAIIAVLMIVNEFMAKAPSEAVNAAMGRRNSQLTDMRINAESVTAMGMTAAMTERWSKSAAELAQLQRSTADTAVAFSAATKAFRLLMQSAVLAMGAYLALRHEISPGLMIAASIVSARALAPAEQVIANWRGFVSARQAMDRIRAALAPLQGHKARMALPLPRSTLSAGELAVAAPGTQTPVIHGVNFTLEAGEAVGVLGLSGCGKSSLIRTLIGVWPPARGTVRLDGSEIGHYEPTELGRAIGYLPQMVELFEGTVAENIARFQHDAQPAAIIAAARQAGIHDLIAQLPQGYDTPIGGRGALLSAGQRQRIGLARALYGDPFLILLDEPNSNLDAAGDAALNQALLGAKARGAIVVVVAHRPSAIASVDKLLFLQDGRQAAFGPREEVLAAITAQPTSLAEARKAKVT